MYGLSVYLGRNLIDLHNIEKEYTTIGRHRHANVILENQTVSRRHARIRLKDGGLWLEEFGRTNGVFVNGRKISAVELVTQGDIISIGPYDLLVEKQVTLNDFESGIFDIDISRLTDPSSGSHTQVPRTKTPSDDCFDSKTSFISLSELRALQIKGATKRQAYLQRLGTRKEVLYPLEQKKRLVMGLSKETDIPVKGNWLTPKLCAELTNSKGQFFIKSLSFRSAIFVNGQKQKEYMLKDQDIIRIGDSEYQFFAGIR